LRGLQQKIYQELWQLCDGERAYSINRDNLLNLARFKDDHPLTPTPHHLQVLFNIFPLSNWALIDSLGASPRRPLYAEQILTALDAAWFKDYLQDQQRQRQRVRQPASDGEGQY